MEIFGQLAAGAMMIMAAWMSLASFANNFTLEKNGYSRPMPFAGRVAWFVWCWFWVLAWFSLL